MLGVLKYPSMGYHHTPNKGYIKGSCMGYL